MQIKKGLGMFSLAIVGTRTMDEDIVKHIQESLILKKIAIVVADTELKPYFYVDI